MKKVLTITGTALAAAQGVAHAKADHAHLALSSLAMKDLSYAVSMAVPTNAADAVNMFASHASHSSHSSHSSHYSSSGGSYGGHSSHSSHSSHYSGSGGSYQSPTYSAPAPKASPAPASPEVNGLYSAPKPTADRLKMIIMRVQAALYSKGYDPGAIDGVLSTQTKQALRKFQSAHNLPADAKMSTATLNALGVSLSP
ncbi:peptidoglycan-binding protein [Oleiagrimonas soli]|uniref:Peptidoglycan binding-like domain-containing protein n=2 Tax=Oleiagrimonas soli TaxID=1543381 RepID=A0A841KGT2_9GAMM|nr:peptidoglycan-binding protein [Oleiagrimonas soli]MBB6182939.1 hypothetical protein [Oleiagrimonas soli]